MRTIVRLGLVTLSTAIAVGLMAGLFAWSEKIIHYQNNFTRRFPPHAAQQAKDIDLRFNSYYFAGTFRDKIYLGNFTAPLQVTVIDTAFTSKTVVRLNLKEKDLPFHAPQLRVFRNTFFLFEGSYPYIFKGDTQSWTASLATKKGQSFSQLEPVTENLLAVRFDAPKTAENLIGLIDLGKSGANQWNEMLLEKQIDGIFDTDGSLQTDPATATVVYTYRYRNQFIVAGSDLQLRYRGNTIDTVAHARIKLKSVHNGQTKLAEPPLIVNRFSAVAKGLLFVNSALPGKNESEQLWKNASIVDIYALDDKSYQGSIPLYWIGGKRPRAINVAGNHLFALVDNHLVSYYLRKHLTNKT